jgi:hypothetical protein
MVRATATGLREVRATKRRLISLWKVLRSCKEERHEVLARYCDVAAGAVAA